MPIRIVPDLPNGGENQQKKYQRSQSKGGGLASLLPMLISFIIKKPKLLIPIAIIAILFYFFGGNLFSSESAQMQQALSLFTGAEFDQAKYDETQVFEPLADNINNPLPEKVTLIEFCPTRRNQGSQGSCVGWSSAYAARTILAARASGLDPNKVAISPSSVYNQIALPNCQGAYIMNAMELMQQKGALLWDEFPYNENNCSTKPTASAMQKASLFKTKGYNRLTPGSDPRGVDLLAIKQNLAQGAPVVIGMMVGGSFMRDMYGKNIWLPTQSDYNMSGFGGHAMCVIGYDDYLKGGAFQIMNSWGEEWGQQGIAWVKYSDFEYFTKEAYGLYPMGDANKFDPKRFELSFGLIDQSNNKVIHLKHDGGRTFSTIEKFKKMGKFKIQVTNNIECYTYIFGSEVDQRSYVLFPYTKKHSPYCGITGTRVFPKDASLQADEVGSEDLFAVVVSKEPLNYVELNDRINSLQDNFESRIIRLLSVSGGVNNTAKYSTDKGLVSLTSSINGQEVEVIFIKVDK